MHKVLITGGSGTIGEAFIRKFYDEYEFVVVSRNESMQHKIRMLYPRVACYMCDINDQCSYSRIVGDFKPNTVVHAAAIKHVDIAENQPMQTINVNVVGSMNVIEASIEHGVSKTIAISTDKACEHSNVYGMTKFLMERCFLEADSISQRFAVCRFGNVAHSNGSVLPFWKRLKDEGKPLRITDPRMNRLMFSQSDAAGLIRKGIDMMSLSGGFILSKKMKTVNMLRLAKAMSDNVEIVGIRPGEKIDEDLISEKELPYTCSMEDGHVLITKEINNSFSTRLESAYNTKTAESMSEEEMYRIINER